jgi:hypothetical protein
MRVADAAELPARNVTNINQSIKFFNNFFKSFPMLNASNPGV